MRIIRVYQLHESYDGWFLFVDRRFICCFFHFFFLFCDWQQIEVKWKSKMIEIGLGFFSL